MPDWKEIHHRCVERLGKGNVLWDPTPDRKGTPQSYQRRGPRIGDVGMLSRQGNFRYNFSMTLPANHPDNVLRVPTGFQPLIGIDNSTNVDVTTTESDLGHRATFPLSTKSMIWNERDKQCVLISHTPNIILSDGALHAKPSHEITFTTPSPPEHGVLMFFGDGLESEQLTETYENALIEGVGTRAYDWYKHLMSRQYPVANGDLQVVVGTEKASYWLTATVSRIVSNINDFSFVVKYYPKPTGNLNSRCLYEHNGTLWTHVLTGPGEAEIAALRTRPNQKLRNQAMFVKTMTATLAEDECTRLQKEVKLKSSAKRSQPCPGKTISHTSATPSRGSKSTQANMLTKKSLWTPTKRLLVQNMSASTSSAMTSDESHPSSEDDYDWGSGSSPLSSDECLQPDDELEKHDGQKLQWIGVVCFRVHIDERSHSKETQENHPSRLLNKALIKEVR